MNAPLANRREFLAGFAACLALLFAPFHRFFDGLAGMLASFFEASTDAIADASDAYEFRVRGYYNLEAATPGYNLWGGW